MKPEIIVKYERSSEVITLGKNYFELLDASYKNQMQHFINIIRNIESPRVNLQDGIRDMKAAMNILNKIGRN
jgi:hypothetical protein